MLFPIAQMVEGREPPLCVPQSMLVKDALKLMIRNGYSQLPVVDRDGRYVGMISERVVAHTYYLLEGRVPILDLTLDHCLERTDPLTVEDDLLEACDRLREDEYAVVIVRERRPVGIITSNDLTDFFRRRSEDFIKVEDIEVTLRLRTRDAFPTDEAMDQALMRALGPNPANPSRPRREFNELSLGDMLAVMTHEENWPRFNGMFEPLDLFKSIMHQVRMVRNQLAHFRGKGDEVQNSTLRYAMDWLSMRSFGAREDDNPARRVTIEKGDIPARTSDNRWDILKEWLSDQRKTPDGIRMSFRDIEALLGGLLPKAARKHTAWWTDDDRHEAQVVAWLDAGWDVSRVDVYTGEVTFVPLSSLPTGSVPGPQPAARPESVKSAEVAPAGPAPEGNGTNTPQNAPRTP